MVSFSFTTNASKIAYDWRYKQYKSFVNIFDKNNDGVFDQAEIANAKKMFKEAAGEDNYLDRNELNNLAKKLGTSADKALSFFADLDGDCIAADLRDSLDSLFSFNNDLDKSKKLIGRINKNNVKKVNYSFSNKNKSSSLVDKILKSYSFSEAKSLISTVANAVVGACKDKNIEIKATLEKFNLAMKNNDKNNISKYLNQMSAMLDYKDVNVNAISDRIEMNKATSNEVKITADNLEDMKYYAKREGVDSESKDLVGDGILANTKSAAMTKKGGIVLEALNILFKDDNCREKISASVSKVNNGLCTYIPKTNNTHAYTENGLSTTRVPHKTVIGDADTSVFVYAILKEAEFAGKEVKNAAQTAEFIKSLYNL